MTGMEKVIKQEITLQIAKISFPLYLFDFYKKIFTYLSVTSNSAVKGRKITAYDKNMAIFLNLQ
jgi:hypothetical protein